MLEFLSGIADTLTLIVELIIIVITSMVKFVMMIPQWLAFLTTSFLYIPGIILPFVMFALIVTIIFFLIGKQSG